MYKSVPRVGEIRQASRDQRFEGMEASGVVWWKPGNTARRPDQVIPALPAIDERALFLVPVFRLVDRLWPTDDRCHLALRIGTRVERQCGTRSRFGGIRVDEEHLRDFDDAGN